MFYNVNFPNSCDYLLPSVPKDKIFFQSHRLGGYEKLYEER